MRIVARMPVLQHGAVLDQMSACAGIDDPVIVREVSAHQSRKSPAHLDVDVFARAMCPTALQMLQMRVSVIGVAVTAAATAILAGRGARFSLSSCV